MHFFFGNDNRNYLQFYFSIMFFLLKYKHIEFNRFINKVEINKIKRL